MFKQILKPLAFIVLGSSLLSQQVISPSEKVNATGNEYSNLVSVQEVGHTFDISYRVEPTDGIMEKVVATMYFWASFKTDVPNYVDGYSLVVESMPNYNFYNIKLYEFSNGTSKDVCGGTVNFQYAGESIDIRAIMDDTKLWVYVDGDNVPVITKNVSMLNEAHTGNLVGFRSLQENQQISEIEIRPFSSFPSCKTVKVLWIGNSYGEDSCTYVHEIARAAGINLIIASAFYGGSTLAGHKTRIINDEHTYQYFKNAGVEKIRASLDDIIYDEKWEYVIIQGGGNNGVQGILSSYNEFGFIMKHVQEWVPNASFGTTILWAKGKFLEHTGDVALEKYDDSSDKQYEETVKCVNEVAATHDLDFVIPNGHAVRNMNHYSTCSDTSLESSYFRDNTCHNDERGRYLQGCCIFHTITGLPVRDNEFRPAGYSYYNYGTIATKGANEKEIFEIWDCIEETYEEGNYWTCDACITDNPLPVSIFVQCSQKNYSVGEYFDYSKVDCFVSFDDLTERKVNTFVGDIRRPLTKDDKYVTISYSGLTARINITVS